MLPPELDGALRLPDLPRLIARDVEADLVLLDVVDLLEAEIVVLAAGGRVRLGELHALAFHVIGALAAVGVLVHLWRKDCPPRLLAAVACVSSLFVSPYSYDYDLAILGVAIAFVLPEVIERARKWELLGMLALLWFATGYGLALVVYFGDPDTGLRSVGLWSLGAPALILLVIASCSVLCRKEPLSAAGSAQCLATGGA